MSTAVVLVARSGAAPSAVVSSPSGERSFAHHVGACAALDLPWLGRELPLLARAEWVLLGYAGLLPGLEPDLAAAVRLLHQSGCRVALETGGSGGRIEDVAPALPFVDLYVPSLDEAAAQTACLDPLAIIARYRELGCRGLVGVKAGTRGVVLSPATGERLVIPCLPAPGEVADTTGAGDAFLAGLLTGIVRGMSPREAGRLGAAAAACCVTGVGATAGLRSFDATQALARDAC